MSASQANTGAADMSQGYEITQFLKDIEMRLREAGLEPQPDANRGQAETAAAMLLTALNITPFLDHVEFLRRSDDKPWPEKDENRYS